MKRLIFFCVLIVLGLSHGMAQESGAGTKYKGLYIGGVDAHGKNIFSIRSKPSKVHLVSSAKEFLSAVNSAKAGIVIYIKDNSIIDLSAYKKINIPGGVTIMGNRGVNKSKGPLIITKSHGVHPLFEVIGDNVTFTGLRIRGAEGSALHNGFNAFSGVSEAKKKKDYLKLYNKTMYATQVSSGIATNKNNLTIENCELSQWTYTAIYLKRGAKNARIRYCFIHHNQRFGLGYGIHVDQSQASIVGNLFDYNRHSIASTGREGSMYVAEYNIFRPGGNETWAVDVHGGKDWGNKSDIAGDYITVKNNTFYLQGEGQAVVIRGRSKQLSSIEQNKIIRLDDKNKVSIEQRNAKGNFSLRGNVTLRGKK